MGKIKDENQLIGTLSTRMAIAQQTANCFRSKKPVVEFALFC
jgi:hypothetical protein